MYYNVGDRVYTLDAKFNLVPCQIMSIKTTITQTQVGETEEREYELLNENDGNSLIVKGDELKAQYFDDAWSLYTRVSDLINAFINEATE